MITESRNNRTHLVTLAVGSVAAAIFLAGCGDRQASPAGDEARQAALASEHSPTVGDAGAKVHIVEFLDPACGTCALFYPMVKGWMAEVPGEIRLSIRHVPFHDGVHHMLRLATATRGDDRDLHRV